jgi:TolB-like protein
MARRVRTGSLAVVLLAAAAGYWFFGLREGGSTLDRKSIAVLPLDNLSGEEASEPFTNGIHDDILTHLYKIGDLKVISRTSVMEYRDTKKNLRQIADELGVATVLEGGVQRSGNRVRINVQLIDAETDEHLWAETYEEDLTAQNVFTIQTDIAERIARALRARLSPAEREHLTYQPTQSVEAYDAYLTAREYQRRWRAADEDRRIAVQLFERAIELDANFALAYADLSAFQSKVCWIYGCRSELIERAKELAETALELEPDLAQAHIALGNYHYYASVDYVGAIEEYNRAIKLAPNNGDAYSQLTAVQARAGDLDGALVSARKAAELSPRSSDTFDFLGYIQMWLRDYEAAAQSYDRAIALAPDLVFSYMWKAWASLNQRGGERQASEAWAQLQQATGKSLAPFSAMFYGRAALRTLGESLQDAVRAQIPAWAGDTISVLLSGAIIYDVADESESARVSYDSARVYLEGDPAGLGPEYRHSALGIAYAGLGRVDESIREARMAVELLPVSRDALEGPWFVAALAEVYVIVGKETARASRRCWRSMSRPLVVESL